MKIINSQAELDALKEVKKDEEVSIEAELRLNHNLHVYGKLRINRNLDSSMWECRYVVARENSSVEAWGNSSVVARENSSVEAWGNSSVEAWGNSSVEAWGNSVVRAIRDTIKVILHGFSVCFMPFDMKLKVQVKSKHGHIQKIKNLGWFENNGVEKRAKVILYKRVSKDFKTQEGTSNETLWAIGSVVEHKDWKPGLNECGEGKFHACSRPYFCDEFRDKKDDKYIAIEVAAKDLFEWKNNPEYPHKIAFRKGKVMYECDKRGKKKE